MVIVFHDDPLNCSFLKGLELPQSCREDRSPNLSTVLEQTSHHCFIQDESLFPIFNKMACPFGKTQPRLSTAYQANTLLLPGKVRCYLDAKVLFN